MLATAPTTAAQALIGVAGAQGWYHNGVPNAITGQPELDKSYVAPAWNELQNGTLSTGTPAVPVPANSNAVVTYTCLLYTSWYASDTGYFNVYPYYASPTQWLADYVLGAALQTAYLIETASGQTQTNDATGEVYAVAPSPVTSDLKQQLQDDIRDQITIESTAAQNQDNPTVVTGCLLYTSRCV